MVLVLEKKVRFRTTAIAGEMVCPSTTKCDIFSEVTGNELKSWRIDWIRAFQGWQHGECGSIHIGSSVLGTRRE